MDRSPGRGGGGAAAAAAAAAAAPAAVNTTAAPLLLRSSWVSHLLSVDDTRSFADVTVGDVRERGVEEVAQAGRRRGRAWRSFAGMLADGGGEGGGGGGGGAPAPVVVAAVGAAAYEANGEAVVVVAAPTQRWARLVEALEKLRAPKPVWIEALCASVEAEADPQDGLTEFAAAVEAVGCVQALLEPWDCPAPLCNAHTLRQLELAEEKGVEVGFLVPPSEVRKAKDFFREQGDACFARMDVVFDRVGVAPSAPPSKSKPVAATVAPTGEGKPSTPTTAGRSGSSTHFPLDSPRTATTTTPPPATLKSLESRLNAFARRLLLRALLDLAAQALEEAHEDDDAEGVIKSLCARATLHHVAGDFDEAQAAYESALAALDTTLDDPTEPDNERLALLQMIAEVALERGDLAQGEARLREVLVARRAALSALVEGSGDSPRRSRARHAAASVLKRMAQRSAADSARERVVLALQALSRCMMTAHRERAAEPLLREGLALSRELHGANHPLTTWWRRALATALLRRSAMALSSPTPTGAGAAVGMAHPLSSHSYSSAAASMGEPTSHTPTPEDEEAVQLLSEACDASKAWWGEDHPEVAVDMLNLAVASRTAEALGWARSALGLRERVFGPDHPLTLKARRAVCELETKWPSASWRAAAAFRSSLLRFDTSEQPPP